MKDRKQKDQRLPETEERKFEPQPNEMDIDKLGPLLVERNREVLEMLEEYDRRQEKRRSSTR